MTVTVPDNDQIDHILQAVGLVVSFESEGFLSLDDDDRRRVHSAVARYEEVVGIVGSNRKARSVAFSLMQHRPGRKSALFRRLLSGREPFPVPPPTSYSYPWYGLLDAPGPRSVSIGGGGTLASEIRAADIDEFLQGTHESLMVNQDAWIIERCNDSARRLMAQWSSEEASDEAAALAIAKSSEWIIRHPGAPTHRVYWGDTGVIQEGYVANLPSSVQIGEFEIVREVLSREEDERIQREARAVALSEAPAPAQGSIARTLMQRARENYLSDDWRPIDRGPFVAYRRSSWMIAPMASTISDLDESNIASHRQ